MQNNTLRNFNRDVKRAGIEPIGQLSIHTLRKCCIKTWADHLPPNVTQTLVGHSDLKTTMQYYSQVDDYHRKKAAHVMDQWLKVTPRGDHTDSSDDMGVASV